MAGAPTRAAAASPRRRDANPSSRRKPAPQGRQPEQPLQARATKKADPGNRPSRHNHSQLLRTYAFSAAFTATAQATVAPTMGLLPMPMRPIMSTCAGTEEEPANWASECMRPMVSVMP